MTDLTNAQKVFRARLAIRDWMGEFETDDGDQIATIDLDIFEPDELADLGVEEDIVDGYKLAEADLIKARAIMEEQAAFGYLVRQLQEEHPDTPIPQLQKAARALVADPSARAQAAIDSGVYRLFAENAEIGLARIESIESKRAVL